MRLWMVPVVAVATGGCNQDAPTGAPTPWATTLPSTTASAARPLAWKDEVLHIHGAPLRLEVIGDSLGYKTKAKHALTLAGKPWPAHGVSICGHLGKLSAEKAFGEDPTPLPLEVGLESGDTTKLPPLHWNDPVVKCFRARVPRGGLVFEQDRKRKRDKGQGRVLLRIDGNDRVFFVGDASPEALRDVELVALEKNEATGKKRTCDYGRKLDLHLFETTVTLYERKSGNKLGTTTLPSTKDCPVTVHATARHVVPQPNVRAINNWLALGPGKRR